MRVSPLDRMLNGNQLSRGAIVNNVWITCCVVGPSRAVATLFGIELFQSFSGLSCICLGLPAKFDDAVSDHP